MSTFQKAQTLTFHIRWQGRDWRKERLLAHTPFSVIYLNDLDFFEFFWRDFPSTFFWTKGGIPSPERLLQVLCVWCERNSECHHLKIITIRSSHSQDIIKHLLLPPWAWWFCFKWFFWNSHSTSQMKPVKSKAEEYDCLFPLTGLLFSASTGNCEWASQVGFKTTNITTITNTMNNTTLAPRWFIPIIQYEQRHVLEDIIDNYSKLLWWWGLLGPYILV